jgi:hypothetical protein
MRLAHCALSLVVSACSDNSGISPAGIEPYVVSHEAPTSSFGADKLKEDALHEAEQRCHAEGKKLRLVRITEAQPPFILGNFPKIEIKFICHAADSH